MMNYTVKSREEIDEQYKWDLKDIFISDESWETAFNELNTVASKLEGYKGRLSESSVVLAQALTIYQRASADLMELYTYAKMSKDLDNRDPVHQGMYDRIVSEYFRMSAITAFMDPEISSIDESTLRQWITNETALAEYSHFLDNLIRNKDHILSENEERILSGIGPAIDGIGEAFSMLNDVELDFGEVEKDDGSKIKLTHGTYGALREDKSRKVRSQTFEKMHDAYRSFGNTIAAIYTSSVKSDVFFAKTRKFDSCMNKAMFADQLPDKIYTNLIDAIHERLPSYYRYLELRKKTLKLEDLHIYDTAVPIVGETDREYSFEEAKTILREGLAPLGSDYLRDMEELMSGRAIDVYETPGKTSGAYAWGTYGSHPYMLLNWSGKLDDVFTFAHETGHCMHSYYSGKSQSFINSHYPIFLAEIASTVNENVLLKYLLGKCDVSSREGLETKAALLNHYLDGVKGTVIRQTMFAEFEYKIHLMVEEGKAVTAQVLSETYGSLLQLYFGDGVVIDEYMKWEWARIPHFYNAYYVYKYATGFCAAALISTQLYEDVGAAGKYNKFLSAGGNDYPSNILGIMGIDMTEPEAVKTTMDLFEERVEELEDILRKLGCY